MWQKSIVGGVRSFTGNAHKYESSVAFESTQRFFSAHTKACDLLSVTVWEGTLKAERSLVTELLQHLPTVAHKHALAFPSDFGPFCDALTRGRGQECRGQ